MSCYEILNVPQYASIADIHVSFNKIANKTSVVFSAYLMALEMAMFKRHAFDVLVDVNTYIVTYNNFSHSVNSIKDLKDVEDL
jgi:hypothetical protein